MKLLPVRVELKDLILVHRAEGKTSKLQQLPTDAGEAVEPGDDPGEDEELGVGREIPGEGDGHIPLVAITLDLTADVVEP